MINGIIKKGAEDFEHDPQADNPRAIFELGGFFKDIEQWI
jgi:hypothetical protein